MKTLSQAVEEHIRNGWTLIYQSEGLAQMTMPKRFDWLIFGSTIAVGLLTFGTGFVLTGAYVLWYLVSKPKTIAITMRDDQMLIDGNPSNAPAPGGRSLFGLVTRYSPLGMVTNNKTAQDKDLNKKIVSVGAIIAILAFACVMFCCLITVIENSSGY